MSRLAIHACIPVPAFLPGCVQRLRLIDDPAGLPVHDRVPGAHRAELGKVQVLALAPVVDLVPAALGYLLILSCRVYKREGPRPEPGAGGASRPSRPPARRAAPRWRSAGR